jgi:hypothetical protein
LQIIRQFIPNFVFHDPAEQYQSFLKQSLTVLKVIVARASVVCNMWVGKTEARHHFEDVGLIIILKWNLTK